MNIAKICHSNYIIARFRIRQTFVWWLSTGLKTPIAYCLVGFGIVLRGTGFKTIGLKLLLKGRRASNVPCANSIIKSLVAREQNNQGEFSALINSRSLPRANDLAGRILILKVPTIENNSLLEKGAVIVKFTETFFPLFQLLDAHLLSKYFHIILEPSWVGYSLPEILIWANLNPEKVIVLSPYEDDYNLLSNTESNLIPITLGPADWVNPTTFSQDFETHKHYDSIYVANFNPKKRVERYIQAVVRISRTNPDFRAALVIAGHGQAQREVLEVLASARGKAKISYFPGVNQKQLNRLFSQSKVNVLLSLREGANKGLAEGLFAGTPALLISQCACGNYRHISQESGRIISDSELEDTLIWFSNHYHQFHPRRWAEAHISPKTSTRVLSSRLRDIELVRGKRWTSDLLPKVNQPELAYLNESDTWLNAKRQSLIETFTKGATEKAVLQFLSKLGKQNAT